MSSDYVLPDSRTAFREGSVRSPYGNLIPVYCASCGKEWGRVREQDCTFAFVLCNGCADKHGAIAHTYKEPDAAFRERTANACAEGRLDLSDPVKLQRQLADPNSVASKLAREWELHIFT